MTYMFNLIHYYLQTCLKTLEINVLKYINQTLHIFLSALGLAWQACLNKTGIELELLTDNNMLMMHENGIRGGMCNAVYRYAKANNNYMKNIVTIIIFGVLGFKQYGWMNNVRKAACKWF